MIAGTSGNPTQIASKTISSRATIIVANVSMATLRARSSWPCQVGRAKWNSFGLTRSGRFHNAVQLTCRLLRHEPTAPHASHWVARFRRSSARFGQRRSRVENDDFSTKAGPYQNGDGGRCKEEFHGPLLSL